MRFAGHTRQRAVQRRNTYPGSAAERYRFGCENVNQWSNAVGVDVDATQNKQNIYIVYIYIYIYIYILPYKLVSTTRFRTLPRVPSPEQSSDPSVPHIYSRRARYQNNKKDEVRRCYRSHGWLCRRLHQLPERQALCRSSRDQGQFPSLRFFLE